MLKKRRFFNMTTGCHILCTFITKPFGAMKQYGPRPEGSPRSTRGWRAAPRFLAPAVSADHPGLQAESAHCFPLPDHGVRHRDERHHLRSHGIEQCRVVGRDDDIHAPTGSLFAQHPKQQLGM